MAKTYCPVPLSHFAISAKQRRSSREIRGIGTKIYCHPFTETETIIEGNGTSGKNRIRLVGMFPV
jgi:hypothetical protein